MHFNCCGGSTAVNVDQFSEVADSAERLAQTGLSPGHITLQTDTSVMYVFRGPDGGEAIAGNWEVVGGANFSIVDSPVNDEFDMLAQTGLAPGHVTFQNNTKRLFMFLGPAGQESTAANWRELIPDHYFIAADTTARLALTNIPNGALVTQADTSMLWMYVGPVGGESSAGNWIEFPGSANTAIVDLGAPHGLVINEPRAVRITGGVQFADNDDPFVEAEVVALPPDPGQSANAIKILVYGEYNWPSHARGSAGEYIQYDGTGQFTQVAQTHDHRLLQVIDDDNVRRVDLVPDFTTTAISTASKSEMIGGAEPADRIVSPLLVRDAVVARLVDIGPLAFKMAAGWPLDEPGTGTRFDRLAINEANLTAVDVTDASGDSATGFVAGTARLHTNSVDSPSLYLASNEDPFSLALRFRIDANNPVGGNGARFLAGFWDEGGAARGLGLRITADGDLEVLLSEDGATSYVTTAHTPISITPGFWVNLVYRYMGNGTVANGRGSRLAIQQEVGGGAQTVDNIDYTPGLSSNGIFRTADFELGGGGDQDAATDVELSIQQVFFWNRALTDADVELLFNAGHWSFINF